MMSAVCEQVARWPVAGAEAGATLARARKVCAMPQTVAGQQIQTRVQSDHKFTTVASRYRLWAGFLQLCQHRVIRPRQMLREQRMSLKPVHKPTMVL